MMWSVLYRRPPKGGRPKTRRSSPSGRSLVREEEYEETRPVEVEVEQEKIWKKERKRIREKGNVNKLRTTVGKETKRGKEKETRQQTKHDEQID